MNLGRRDFLRAGALTVLGTAIACGNDAGSGGAAPAAPGSIQELMGASTQAFEMFSANAETLSGRTERFAFALLEPGQGIPLSGGDGRIWFAPDRTTAASGPFPASYRGEGLGERGVYVADVEFPSDGGYLVLVEAQPNGKEKGFALANVGVGPRLPMPRPGDAAIAFATPTVRNERGVDPICTLEPPCSMHQVSLDRAIASDRPTVMIIGSPAFCSSRLCGPEVEIVDRVAEEFRGDVHFVHVEVYKDDDPETVANQVLSPAATAWKLASEPVLYWIEPGGTIRERYIGPVDLGDVRDATRALAG